MSPAAAMDDTAQWANDHHEMIEQAEVIPAGEVIELPEGVGQRLWDEAQKVMK